ncbi:glycosyl hydrolase [Arthrobacter psychrolactophilus]|uniref:Glycosyl hydrolase n=1 Tax=Arthrobacter psychrolactophilus TaxID=92442 RepID=A0A2V5IPB9_9MICC|nr:glycoside hydrolase family 127 protein [Arthrobacter psychrolactophilus]PYI38405.1 glycosyl hydrolase [Arthrobacter psychrolactophilus]
MPSIEPINLKHVRLLEGMFSHSQNANITYLLRLNPDRLLAPYRREAGLPELSPSYGNWENSGLDGHTAGHYLSAAAMLYAATGEPRLLDRLTYMIDGLSDCQRTIGSGYLGGIPDGHTFWEDVKNGVVGSDSFSLGGRWVPWYNLHKLFVGLLDASRYAGNNRAMETLVALADWWLDAAQLIDDGHFERMLDTEFGGMNEVFADLAVETGRSEYLSMAKRFTHHALADPLTRHEDRLTGLHANTQIPKVIGYEAVAALTGDEHLANAADEFWRIVVDTRSVVIGGNSVREHFHSTSDFTPMIIEREGPETCNSYNMLRLSARLYSRSGDNKYLDYYERTLFNHILASQHPEHGGFVYFTPLRPGHYRVYSDAEENFWCCVGTGMESHSKLGDMIFARNGEDLEVNLFIASEIRLPERNITVRQETNFPFDDTTRITFTGMDQAQTFTLSIRVPGWTTGPVSVSLNGVTESVEERGGRLHLNRTWSEGDTVEVRFSMAARLEHLPGRTDWGAILYGPVVLAARSGTEHLVGLVADGSRMGHVSSGPLVPLAATPVLPTHDSEDLTVNLRVMDRNTLRFAVSDSEGQELELEPFFTLHDSRYVVYWPLTSGVSVAERRRELLELDEELLGVDSRTLDQVILGEQQPESDHGFTGTATRAGLSDGIHWRETSSEFTLTMRNRDGLGRLLRVSRLDSSPSHGFDLLVDGALILSVTKPDGAGAVGVLIDEDYEIPAALSVGKDELIVRIVAPEGVRSGRIHALRLLAAENEG